MQFYISQICGLVVSLAAILSMQLKNIKHILVCQLVCNGIGALSYIMLGGLSGCGIYLVALLQTISYSYFRIKEKKAPIWLAMTFIIAYLLCVMATYKGPTDLISALAAFTCAMGLVQEKASGYRIFMLLNGSVWMIYDIAVCAYAMIISHVATAISAAVGIIRLDIKTKNEK